MAIPTIEQVEESGANMDTITEEVKSSAHTLIDQYGDTRKTMTGREAESDEAIRTIGGIDIGDYSSDPLINKSYEYVVFDRNGTPSNWKIKTGVSLDYQIDSTTYPTPQADPNLQAFQDQTKAQADVKYDVHNTLTHFKADTSVVEGMALRVEDRADGLFDVVSGETANGFNIIQHNTLSLQLKLRTENNVVIPAQWGANTTGVTPSDAVVQHIIATYASTGVQMDFTEGAYLFNSTASADGLDNGALVPFVSYENDKKFIFNGIGNVEFKANDNDMILLRASNAGTEANNITFDANGKTGCWGFGAIPALRNTDNGVVSQSHCRVFRCRFIGLDEGFVGEPSNLSGGSDSGAFYLQVHFNDFRDCTRSIWLKGAMDGTANRPTRSNLSFNRAERGNTGIDLEYATETTCMGNNFEFMNEAGPVASGSAYHLGARAENNYIYGGHSEAGTLDINNEANESNNSVNGFTLLNPSYRADFMAVNSTGRMRLTYATGSTQQLRVEARYPSFAALVFDYAGAGQKSAAIELNGTNQMTWFNGVTTNYGTLGYTEFPVNGISIEGSTEFAVLAKTSFVRLRAGADACYIGTVTDNYRMSPDNIRPTIDGTQDLGENVLRFNDGYFVNTPIGSSDRNLKDFEEAIPDVVLDAWALVEKKRYKWKTAVESKGSNARWHIGVIAQDVVAAFESLGLNAYEYGVLCFNTWERQELANGDIVEAGERFGIRYGQAAQLDAALERRERQRLESKLDQLLSTSS